QVQRARLIHCNEYWGKYNEVKTQGIYVLRFIRELYSGTRKGGALELGKENRDKDLAMLIVEVVMTIVKCVGNARCKDEADVVELCKETTLVNFLEFVDYCANKCRNATVNFCGVVSTHFNNLANDFSQVKLSPIDLIMRLYVISLSFSDMNYYSRGGSPEMAISGKDISISKLLLDMENRLQELTTVHDVLCGFDDNSYPIKLPNIEDDFHHFILVSSASDNDGDVYNNYIVLSVAIAALTLSFAT
nr:hypothetical protein [Tanacetum cinerariifolium]